MPEALSLAVVPNESAIDAKEAVCSCAFASSVHRSASCSERSSRRVALQQLSLALSAHYQSGSRPSLSDCCPLLASHCQQLFLPLIERRLRDESEAVRSAAVDVLCQSAALLRHSRLCSLCLLAPLLNDRLQAERAEEARCGLLHALRDCCLSAGCLASAVCHAGNPSILAALSSLLLAGLSDSCPAVRCAAAECAALLPSVLPFADRSFVPSLSSILSSVCQLVRQRLDVRKAAMAALAALVPFTAVSERDCSRADSSSPSSFSSSSAGLGSRPLSLPAAVHSSAEVLSSLCVDAKLSVRSLWFGCLSTWLLWADGWQRADELWLLSELLLLLDDDDTQLRGEALACLTQLSARGDCSVAEWLSQRAVDVLLVVLRSLNGWKDSERLRGCRQLSTLLTHASSSATSALVDRLLPAVCVCLLDDDRAVREKARAALMAGADKWSAHCCIAAVQRTIVKVQQEQNGQSAMVTSALLALDVLLESSTARTAAALSVDDNDALLALLQSLLTQDSAIVSSSSSSASTPRPLALSSSSLPPLLSLSRRVVQSVNAAEPPDTHSTASTQHQCPAVCQPCRLFMTLHELDCCMDEDTGGQRGAQWEELHDELLTVMRAVSSDGAMYVRCLPLLLAALDVPADDSEAASVRDERSAALVVPGRLLLWLRRSGDAVLSQWRVVLPLWAAVMAGRCSSETDRASVVSCVAALLSSSEHSSRLSDTQRAALMRWILLPGCEWRPGAVNAVVRLHSLSCLHSSLSAAPSWSSSAAALGEEEAAVEASAADECGLALTERLLAALRSHVEDEQAACREAALLALQAVATSTRGSHLTRMNGTTRTTSLTPRN